MTMFYASSLRPISEDELKELAASSRGNIGKIFVHWSAGRHHQIYDDYHICIDADGKIYSMCDNLEEKKKHTYQRNSGNIAVSMMCAYDAEANNGADAYLGPEPPTAEQIEATSKAIAVLCDQLGINIDSDSVMTHCEIALIDGYGPHSGDSETRWDLWYIPDFYNGGSMVPGGDLIRGKAAWYQQQEAHNDSD